MSCDSNNGQKCNSRNKGKAVIVNGQMYSEWILWHCDS